MSSRQKQKSLLIDPSNVLHFNVSHQNIHMKKIKNPSFSNNKQSPQNDSSTSPKSYLLNNKIYYSIVQKQSQTGISFNNRLFFLKDDDLFGYMSQTDFNFDIKDAKQTIPLKCLRKVTPKGRLLTLQFQIKLPKQNDKLVEKKWILRMKDKKMADSWTDIINYQVTQIPSRKSTIERQDSRIREQSLQSEAQKYQLTTAQKVTTYFSKTQQPIANQRPEQDYISIKRSQFQLKTPKSNVSQNGSILQSPVGDQFNENNQKAQFSPQGFASKTYDKEQQKEYNSTSQKHSQKKQRYLSIRGQMPYQPQFIAQKEYFSQIQENFKKRNQQLKQKLFLPSFLNYFRPYLDQYKNKRLAFRQQVDKKYEDFVTYCEFTSKQLIDKTDYSLNQYRLSNRFLMRKSIMSKDKLLKQMSQKYELVFGRQIQKSMQIQGLFLVFQNILYIQLQDIQIIIPLGQLKTLPVASQLQNENNSSINKICQNSLIIQFENKQKNLQYVYSQIIKDDILKSSFLIPMSCQIQYKGFNLFFNTKINQNLFIIGNIYDSNKQIYNISLTNNKLIHNGSNQLNLQQIYQKLALALYINPDVIEHKNIIKIKPLKTKNNQFQIISANKKQLFKYVINYCNILPHFQSKQVLNSNIFIQVHQYGKIINFSKQTLNQQRQQSSIKINFNDQDTSFMPSVLQQKSNLTIKKKQYNKLPLYNHLYSIKQNDLQIKHYRQLIQSKIKQTANKLNRFNISIIHPFQLNQLLKTSFLNHSTLGKICQYKSCKNSFVNSIIKSQIAAQCAKFILFKKCQQISLSLQNKQKQKQSKLIKSITTLLNLILGKYQTKQTQLIWKVLTLHSQLLYSVSISQKQIHKGYFILALASKLNIMINPSSSKIDDIFNVDKFILSIKFQSCKVKPVKILSSFFTQFQQLDLKQLKTNCDFYFNKLQQTLGISSNPLPYFIKRSKTLYNKILYVLTLKISPNNLNFGHLNLYQIRQLNFTQTQGAFQLIDEIKQSQTATSLIKQKQLGLKRQTWQDNFSMYIQRKLQQIVHKVNESTNFNLVQQIQSFMKEIKTFYEYHPIISELLQFLADYYSSNYQYQPSLQSLKSSLSNIISVCEGNSNHVKLANCFYKMGLVYEKMRKNEEALNQFKRSKHCLQINKQQNSSLYVVVLIKMANIILLFDGKTNEGLNYIFTAQNILQNDNILYDNVQLIISAYETESKCLYSSQNDLTILKTNENLNRLSRVEHYFQTLERILIKQNQLNKEKKYNKIELMSAYNIQRILKLVLPLYFHSSSQKAGQVLISYICQVSQNIAKKGGIDFTQHKLIIKQQPDTQNNQEQQDQIYFYPFQKSKNLNNEPSDPNNLPQPQPKQSYNYFKAFNYIKQQIYKGQFILQLIEYIQKADQILTIIKKQVKKNILSKSQSRSSSRRYLMSTKGADQWDIQLNESNSGQNKRQQMYEQNDLERLLNFSKQSKQINGKQTGYSIRQRKFDSLMRAIIVLVGDGFMLHIFQE